jgi:hypothetical protein
LAELYRKKVANLRDALTDPATQIEALEILRGLIKRVSVKTLENAFEIELVGEIANMVRLSAESDSFGKEPYRSSVKVVAGVLNPSYGVPWLFDPKQLDVEDQGGVRRNGVAGAAGAVAEIRWNDERARAADLHGGDAFVPAGDDAVGADRKLERLAAIDRRVEFLAFGAVLIEPAGIVHHANLPGLRRRAVAGFGVDDLQPGWCSRDRQSHGGGNAGKYSN